jgi:hypothetical protein
MEKLAFFEQGRLVACFTEPWLKELHQTLLRVEGLPPGDPTWEGEAYNPHATLAKTKNPEQYQDFLKETLRLPIEWTPVNVDVYYKRPGGDIFTDIYNLPFRR